MFPLHMLIDRVAERRPGSEAGSSFVFSEGLTHEYTHFPQGRTMDWSAGVCVFTDNRKPCDADRGTNLPGIMTLTGAFCTLKLANPALCHRSVNIYIYAAAVRDEKKATSA